MGVSGAARRKKDFVERGIAAAIEEHGVGRYPADCRNLQKEERKAGDDHSNGNRRIEVDSSGAGDQKASFLTN
jgi:hypothetical protein